MELDDLTLSGCSPSLKCGTRSRAAATCSSKEPLVILYLSSIALLAASAWSNPPSAEEQSRELRPCSTSTRALPQSLCFWRPARRGTGRPSGEALASTVQPTSRNARAHPQCTEGAAPTGTFRTAQPQTLRHVLGLLFAFLHSSWPPATASRALPPPGLVRPRSQE